MNSSRHGRDRPSGGPALCSPRDGVMNLITRSARILLFTTLLGGFAFSPSPVSAQPQPTPSHTNDIWLEVTKGTVQIAEKASTRWIPTQVSQPLKIGDRLRTGSNTVIMIWWSGGSRLSLGSSSELQVRERPPGEENGFHLFRG